MQHIEDKQLTAGQKRALFHVRKGRNVFITGGAGVGKSAILWRIIHELEQSGKNVAVCAPTGIAALNIGGMTIHGFFGFPLGACINQGSKNRKPSLKERVPPALSILDCLIIDEISMVRRDIFDSVIASVRKSEKSSGRHIQLVIAGDFYQLCPVPVTNPLDISLFDSMYGNSKVNGFAFQGRLWDSCDFYTVILDEAVRQKDQLFIRALNLLRIGEHESLEYLNTAVGNNTCAEPITLCAYNSMVEEANIRHLSGLSGDACCFHTEMKYEKGFTGAIIQKIGRDSIPADLTLKDGARTMLTATDYYGSYTSYTDIRSMLVEKVPTAVNGMMGKVFNVSASAMLPLQKACLLFRTDTGVYFEVSPMSRPLYEYVADGDKLVKRQVASYRQFPLKLAYAQTFHRCQGQTYEAAEIYPQTFIHGQLYTGISRVRSMEGLRLTRPICPEDIKVDPAVTAFYERLGKGGHVPKNVGRPPSGMNGECRNRMLWVPIPLVEHVRREIEAGEMIPLGRQPPYTSGRKHLRIQEELYDSVKAEIDIWKATVKSSHRKGTNDGRQTEIQRM